jgi:uncharacterized repeat protein (TIGR01451 family)
MIIFFRNWGIIVLLFIAVFSNLNPNKLTAQNFVELQKVIENPRFAIANFGTSVSIDGNFAVVGTPSSPSMPINQFFIGAAYVYEKQNGQWQFVQKLTPNDTSNSFGSSVCVKGNLIIVGDPRYDKAGFGQNNNTGAAYIFERQTNWVLLKKIESPFPGRNYQFGTSVAIENDFAVVGEIKLPDVGAIISLGKAHVFKRTGGNWSNNPTVETLSGDFLGGRFGGAVAVNGNSLIVGQHADNLNGAQKGSVFLYRYNGNSWTAIPAQKIIAIDGQDYDHFGFSVTIEGNTAIVGAYPHNLDPNGVQPSPFAGAAYILADNGNNWSVSQKIVANDRLTDTYARFGYSVDLSGNLSIIGALGSSRDSIGQNLLTESGSSYIFKKNTASGQWAESQKINGSYRDALDRFGNTVGISGTDIIVGAYNDDDDLQGANNLTDAGSVFFFEPDCPLSITKTVSQNNVSVGSPVTFTITVCNNGSQTINNINVTDPLSGNFVVQNPGSFTQNGSNLVFSLASLSPNACTTLTFSAYAMGIPCQTNQLSNCVYATTSDCNDTVSACVNLTTSGLSSSGPQYATFSNAILAGALPASGSTNTTSIIFGTILQNLPTYEFGPGSNIFMAPGAEIVVDGERTLILSNAVMQGCDTLWRSITLKPGGGIETKNNSIIRDAQYAIELAPSCRVNCQKTNFLDNFISIYASPTFTNNSFNQFVLLQNVFRTVQGLKRNFIGQSNIPVLSPVGAQGLSGIWVHNLTSFYIGLGQGVILNRFTNLINGIVVYNSDTKVYDVQFTNIFTNNTYPNMQSNGSRLPKGNGIFANGRGGFHTFIQQGMGSDLNSTPSFVNCTNGINSISNTMLVSNNNMINIVNGISSSFAQKRQLTIQNNRIEATDMGIWLFQNDPTVPIQGSGQLAGTDVSNNKITVGRNSQTTGTAGIMIQESNMMGSSFAGANRIEVFNALGGLVETNVSGALNTKDTVLMYYTIANPTSNTDKDGIFVGGSLGSSPLFNASTCNFISLIPVNNNGNPLNNPIAPFLALLQMNSNNQNIDGIHFMAVQSGTIDPGRAECNFINGTHRGLRFDGVNNFTNGIMGNRFRNNFYGLDIPTTNSIIGINTGPFSGIAGTADLSGNNWPNSIPNLLLAQGALEAKNSSGQSVASQFAFNSSTNPDFRPSPYDPAPWFTPAPGTNYDCGTSCGGPISNLIAPPPTLSKLDTVIVKDSLQLDPLYADETKWQAKRELFGRLRANAQLAPAGSDFRIFADSIETQNIGLLESIQESSRAAHSLSASFVAQWHSERMQLNNLEDSLFVLDTLIAVTALAQQAPLLTQRANLLAIIEPLALQCHGKQALVQNNLDNALTMVDSDNQSIATALNIEQWEKILNSIYFNTISKGHDNYSAAEEQALMQIAAGCPLEGGATVLKARSMLGYTRWQRWDDMSGCISPSPKNLISGTKEEIIALGEDFILYPNPASSQLNLMMVSGENEAFHVQITNTLGQNIILKDFNANKKIGTIDISNLNNGIYYLSIIRSDKKVITKVFSKI